MQKNYQFDKIIKKDIQSNRINKKVNPMCGIIGYIGDTNIKTVIIEGLKKLEYRGYDSAGITTINKGRLSIIKCRGRISNLEKLFQKKRKLKS